MKRVFFLFLFFNILITSFSLKPITDPVSKGGYIVLGDIFSDIPERYKSERITTTGMPGTVKKVNAAYINQILSANGLEVLDLEKYSYIDVKTFEFLLDSSYLSKYLRENYSISYPVLINYREKKISTDDFNIKIERRGQNSFIVEIIDNKDNDLLKKFILNYKERFKRKVLVSKYNIHSGDKLHKDLFTYLDMYVPEDISDTFTDINGFKYTEAASEISQGTILLKSHINYAEIVIRGSVVKATYPGDGFFITMKLEAMQGGAFNEIINLKSINDRKKYRGRVTGENKVELIF